MKSYIVVGQCAKTGNEIRLYRVRAGAWKIVSVSTTGITSWWVPMASKRAALQWVAGDVAKALGVITDARAA